MEERWCSGCGQVFIPRAQSPRQSFCAEAACQRERKLLWQRTKRRSDRDYVANQAKANTAWLQRNPDYWKRYRAQQSRDVPIAGIEALLAGSIGPINGDASSTGAPTLGKRDKLRAPCVINWEVDETGTAMLKLNIEIVLRRQKSSSRLRKETT